MDQLAKEAAVEAKTTKVQRPVYSTTVLMGFHTKTDLNIGHIYKYIHYITSAPPMIEYLLKKNNWTFAQLQSICWIDIESALNIYKPYTRIKIAQLMHNW